MAVLSSLTIKNFVLIEDAVLEFAPGLNVLTGETGAGKTLLTKALGLLMGERAEEGLVGTSGSDASIQAVFELDDDEVSDLPEEVKELVGGVESGEFIVGRRLGKEGRNRCFINDNAVTVGAMGGAVGGLLSFAGQHEYRRLLDPRYQLAVLDKWAGAEALELVQQFKVAYERARDATRRLEESRRDEQSRLREIDLLRFQVKELTEAGLSLEEEEGLLGEQRLLARAEDVLRATGGAGDILNGETEAVDAATLLTQATTLVGSLSGVDPDLDAVHSALTDLQCQVGELARELHAYADRVSVDPARLEVVDERVRLYTELARKYGGSTESAMRHLEESRERLELLEGGEEDLSRLEEVRAAETSRALELAARLSAARHEAVPLLERAVASQLTGLGMTEARVTVNLQTRTDWEGLKETGGDSAEFLLAANPGQPPRSLAKTASGGELSRVLLAIKCALAGAGGSETLVFDEIDAGIGGRTAVAVGNKLRELAGGSQLLVITHLPQVAAVASRHFLIDKVSGASDTVARLSALDEEEVVQEMCRMLGGGTDDSEAMALARELRDRAAAGLLD
jgi:DNA repair protein RecN (Recombination protein N)